MEIIILFITPVVFAVVSYLAATHLDPNLGYEPDNTRSY
jgi:hypothetical protein